MKLFPTFLAVAFLPLSGCTTRYTRPITIAGQGQGHPVFVRVHGKYIDEDSPLDYVLQFRNKGTQVVSFDYTVADQTGVPHIDREGPNSGMVKNLYPGAVLEVPNPLMRRNVYVTLGVVSYGKKADPDLDLVYRPKTSLAGSTGSGSGELIPDSLPQ